MSVDYEIPDPFAIEDNIETASGSTVLDAALSAHDAGLCVLRVHPDGTKRPVGSWTAYQQKRPDRSTVESWFGSGHPGVGLVCGAVSGGLEMLEFEGRAVAEGVLTEFLEGLEGELEEVVGRIVDGYSETTPSGGLHLLYRCDTVDGNTKLARRPATDDELSEDPADRVKVLIETRGEGGFTVVAPSHGPTHPTGQPWELVSGGFHSIATITADERAALFVYARKFDTPAQGAAEGMGAHGFTQPRPGLVELGDVSPWERFDREQTCHDVLLSAGFTEDHKTDDGTHYKRPGKTAPGSSATVWSDDGTCTLFSTSIDAPTEFTGGHRKLKPWSLHVALNYAGDFSRAAGDERRKMSVALAAPAPTDVDGPPLSSLSRLRIDWSTFWDTDRAAEDWQLEPVFATGRNHSVTAKAKTGKSEFILTIITPAVLGRAVLERPAGTPLRVLYLDYEMTEADVQQRLEEMGYGPTDDLEPLAYLLHPAIPPLDTLDGGQRVLTLAQEHRADLVVIDTFSRAVAGDEDSNDTVRAFYINTVVPLKRIGTSVTRLDHTGHSNPDRARGASAKGDDVDVGWVLTRSDDGFKLDCRSLRRVSWVPETVALYRRTNPLRVELGATMWPAGTKECADALERLGVAVDSAERPALAALKEAGESFTRTVARAALKYRRHGSTEVLGGEP